MSEIPTYVIIPTADRPHIALECIESVRHQALAVLVLNNGYLPGHISMRIKNAPNVFCADIELVGPPNIQWLWNRGIEMAYEATKGIVDEWNVLILNDDVVCPPNLVESLSNMMRGCGASLAYPDQFGIAPPGGLMNGEASPIDIRRRITGYAYMLRGEEGIKLDESFGWWYGDDDLDWRCRQLGGSLVVPGCAVEHKFPNALTNADEALQKQTGIDRQTFIDKWGKAPH